MSMFLHLLGVYKILEAWNWTQIFKNNLIFGSKFDFISVTRFSLWSYQLQYQLKVSTNFCFSFGIGPKPKYWFRLFFTSAITENIEIQIINYLAPFCSCNNAAISQFFPFLFRFRRWGQTWHINDLKHSAGDMNSIAVNSLNIPRQGEGNPNTL